MKPLFWGFCGEDSCNIKPDCTFEKDAFYGKRFDSMLANPPFDVEWKLWQAVAAFLDRETARIDALFARATTVIERLREYRTALINSAVTGMIDVRATI